MSLQILFNKWVWGLFLPILLTGVLIIPVIACGFFSAPDLLSHGDKSLLAAPVADFYVEVGKLKRSKTPFSANVPVYNSSLKSVWSAPAEKDVYQQTENCAVADLEEALSNQPEEQREKIMGAYCLIRAEIKDYARELQKWKSAEQKTPRPIPPQLKMPKGLPGEFEDYLQGAIAYHQGDYVSAHEAWNHLLARPTTERKYRSTWSAFMLGRCAMQKGNAVEAIRQFEAVRDLSQSGFSDRSGLAAASLGWQARVELDRKNYSQAIGLYLQQSSTGDPTALDSLRETAIRVFRTPDPATLLALSEDESSRQVLTAFLLARGGPAGNCASDLADAERVRAWLDACSKSNIKNVVGADRLAWTAYQAGDWGQAERWLEQAEGTSPIAKWIRAKLFLRKGKIQEAGELLSVVSRLFPAEEEWSQLGVSMDEDNWPEFGINPSKRTLGEWGVLQFARKNYVQALDALLVAGYWEDAAYVAERVLRPNELKEYVDRRWPEIPGKETPQAERADNGASIRRLLARRLTRIGRPVEARVYFKPDMRSKLDAYMAALAAGRDQQRPSIERATKLWEAARIVRYDGIDLMGTEIGPDGAMYQGDIDTGLAAKDIRPDEKAPAELFIKDQDFRDRLAGSVPSPDRRFHYRYIAAQIAWEAFQLMPHDTRESDEVLCETGGWIKYRDPKAGDQFYRALVYRFRSMVLVGKTALALGVGVLLTLAGIVLVRSIRNRQWPQYSFRMFMAMILAAATGLYGGVHWYSSLQDLSSVRTEWRTTGEVVHSQK